MTAAIRSWYHPSQGWTPSNFLEITLGDHWSFEYYWLICKITEMGMWGALGGSQGDEGKVDQQQRLDEKLLSPELTHLSAPLSLPLSLNY